LSLGDFEASSLCEWHDVCGGSLHHTGFDASSPAIH
jgi:hypothetical protein